MTARRASCLAIPIERWNASHGDAPCLHALTLNGSEDAIDETKSEKKTQTQYNMRNQPHTQPRATEQWSLCLSFCCVSELI
jgi:hypothetical protein